MVKSPSRGRLSSIDLLPDEALPFVREALDGLKLRKRTQDDLREELNNHLLSLGLNPVSRSAFNRKSLQIAASGLGMQQVQEISAIMGEKLNDAPEGDVGLFLNQVLKTLIYDVIMEEALSENSPSMAMLKAASDSLMRLERARKISVETRSKLIKEFVGKADEAVTKAAKQAGLSKDQVAQIRRDVLGVVKRD